MKHFLLLNGLLATIALAILTSCNNDKFVQYEDADIHKDFIVTTMDKIGVQTRTALSSCAEIKVLQFKDEDTYTSTLLMLKKMSSDERRLFFQKYGFNNAESFLNNADKELDNIFEIEDSTSFVSSLNSYLKKYKKVLTFNHLDKYDVTPHLCFNDSDKVIIGNELGYVAIGNKLIEPKICEKQDFDDTYVYETSANKLIKAPMNINFIPFKNGAMLVKNGKIRSFFNIGTIQYSGNLAVKLKSLKKKFVWNKEVKYVHQVDFEVTSPSYSNRFFVSKGYGCHEQDLFAPLRQVGQPGTKFQVNVIKFTINNKNKDNTLSPLANSGKGLLSNVILK